MAVDVEAAVRAARQAQGGVERLALAPGKAFAACVMLEDVLGRERFTRVARTLLVEHAHGMIAAADLIIGGEKALGRDLAWLDRDWIDGDVVVSYGIAGVEKTADGLTVKVSQLGSPAFLVVVEAETEDGRKLRQRVSRETGLSVLRFRSDAPLTSVVIDPDGIRPDTDGSDNRWPGGEGGDLTARRAENGAAASDSADGRRSPTARR